MKKAILFISLCFFSLMFIASFWSLVHNSAYGRVLNISGQVGMGISIVLFFIIRTGRK